MNVFTKLKSRQRDIKILSDLLESSLTRSQGHGTGLAGAQHLALSAFEMEDGLAKQVLSSTGSSAEAFAAALDALDASVLAELGLELTDVPSVEVPKTRIGKSDATFEAAMKAIQEIHNENNDYRPLTSAHVLAGVASVEFGVAARVFSALGIDRTAVIAACRAQG